MTRRRSRHSRLLTLSLGTLMVFGCDAPPPEDLGPEGGTLKPCPDTPNCVHTGNRDPDGTEGLFLRDDASARDVIETIRSVVESMPRTTVMEASERYLHAEARSLVFGFVDDLEILVRDDGELVVRSASRLGRSDLGVNRRRVEDLRDRLREAGIIA
ncbi:MAG: DUF1499 domain-containing protein [Longimicrobiales bacterium]|nr:DUF1499 domain-containing protein [Longimicrobiales bacterium]